MISAQMEPVTWAQHVLSNPDKYLILDTETTGLSREDEIIQIAAIDTNGETLLNELVRPVSASVHSRAYEVHGIGDDDLAQCPSFIELEDVLRSAIGQRDIIAYNSSFDERMYAQSHAKQGGFMPNGQWMCAMHMYSRFVAEPNPRGGYRWQKLQGGDHSAIGDCLATLRVIQEIAGPR